MQNERQGLVGGVGVGGATVMFLDDSGFPPHSTDCFSLEQGRWHLITSCRSVANKSLKRSV